MTQPRRLRLWPGVAIVLVQWLSWLFAPAILPQGVVVGVLATLIGGLAIFVWWAFFSRPSRSERWGGVGLMILATLTAWRISDPSMATAGQGVVYFVYALPVLSLSFVVWAAATRHLGEGPRRATMVATILLACGSATLVRSDGMSSEARLDLAWRWSQTAEERLLALEPDTLVAPVVPTPTDTTPAEPNPTASSADGATEAPVTEAPDAPIVAAASAVEEEVEDIEDVEVVEEDIQEVEQEAAWPGFRGPDRNGIVPGVRIETDWSASPPVELWRRPIGPGVGSFAVQGDLLYTQEQRGEDEVVSAYRVSTGEPVWRHGDAARFWDSHAGAGPRGTPTLSRGRVYTFGGTGILNVLDAESGALLWSRDAASDAGVAVPYWGFASSPLVVDDVVIVAVEGVPVAYALDTGEQRWLGPNEGLGYSSPHLATLDGTRQVLLMAGSGLASFAPRDGRLLWEHSWPTDARIVQPALLPDGDVLIGAEGLLGLRRIAVKQGPDGWKSEELWTSIRLKPFFSDFVVHEGHAYGFDGSILASIDIEDGTRKWKGGRYGQGQMILLSEQDLLLVTSEQGELVLVAAAPDRFTEVARFPALESKTWNHPALYGDILLVRNSEEMVAFRLTLAGD